MAEGKSDSTARLASGQLTGRCNCGAVRFVATGPFRPAKACHCRTCRRQSGHFIAATQIDRNGLALTGADAVAWYSSTARARRGFCRLCGTHLFWEPAGSPRVSIWMGCLDEPTGIRLAEHIFVAEQGDYYDIIDGLPQALES
jgi:hypothetical protein